MASANPLTPDWKPSVNIATGLGIIAANVKQHGVRGGLATYNADNPQAPEGRAYAKQVMERQDRIHNLITA